MNTNTPASQKHIDDVTLFHAQAADLLALAGRHTQLKKNAHHDWCGPCPRCGGKDRFHVFQNRITKRWSFLCYQCHGRPGDAIEFVRWLHGADFVEAVQQLAGAPQARRIEPPPPAVNLSWTQRVRRLVVDAQDLLWSDEGEAARAYLERRGLEPHTCLAFGLGYRPDAPVPGTDGKRRAPAIVMPWTAGRVVLPPPSTGKVTAVRYRFLEPQDGAKITAEGGSRFAGRLYGGQVLPRVAERLRTLVLVEGEINCMSIWQCAGSPERMFDWRLDVLSLGSESAKLSPAAVAAIGEYGKVLVWADRGEVARELAQTLPNAHPIRSPGGKDANDLLQEGLLAGFLAEALADAARNEWELEGLLWTLWDAARSPYGLDGATATVCRWLAERLGKQATLVEAEPNRWIAVP